MVIGSTTTAEHPSFFSNSDCEEGEYDNIWCPITFAFCIKEENGYDATATRSPHPSSRMVKNGVLSRTRSSRAGSELGGGSVNQVYVSSVKGMRNTMEDAHDIKTEINGDPNVAAFAVFDGHCGSKASRYCKCYLLDKTIQNAHFSTDIQLALEQSMEYVGDEFSIKADRQGWRDGTTAVVAVLMNGMLVIGNIGDSRAVLGRNTADGIEALDLSRDHKPSDPDERKRIYEMGGLVAKSLAEAQAPVSNKSRRKWMQVRQSSRNGDGPDRAYPGGLSVSRSIGDINIKKEKDGVIIQTPEMRAHKLLINDYFLILACDGLWDVLTSRDSCQAAAEALNTGGDPANALTSLALKKGSTDNVSVVVVVLDMTKLQGKPILKTTSNPLTLKRRVSFSSDTKKGAPLSRPDRAPKQSSTERNIIRRRSSLESSRSPPPNPHPASPPSPRRHSLSPDPDRRSLSTSPLQRQLSPSSLRRNHTLGLTNQASPRRQRSNSGD